MSTLIALSALLLASPALSQSTGTGSCTDVHVFLARGWNEQYPGRQGTFVDDFCADLSGMSCDYEDVAYDASNGDWCAALNEGIPLGTQQIETYAAKCPNSALVVSGYSMGAGLIGGVLAGGGGEDDSTTTCDVTTPISMTSGASCQIAAALLWGDPQHAPNQAYDVLNGTAGQGVYPRTEAQLQALDYYTPRLHSYCQYDDLACAKGLGADSVEAHTDYFEYFAQDGASWAAQEVKAYKKGEYCSSTSTSSTSTAVATSSTSASTSASTASSAMGYSSASTSASTASSAMGYSSASPPLNSSAPVTSSTPALAYTVTDMTTYSTTVCPLTATVTQNGTTSTSIGSTTSLISSVIKTTYTTTAPIYTTPPAVTNTLYETSLITVTSCGPEVVSCPARSTVVKTTSVPVSTSVMTPTYQESGPASSAAPITKTYYTTSKTTVTSASTIVVETVSVPVSTSVVTPTMSVYGMSSSYLSTETSIPATVHTTVSGKPAVVGYSTSISLTTYGPFPTFTHSTAIPTTTQYVGSANGTAYYPTGTGAAKPSGTGVGPVVPYTGGAASIKGTGCLMVAVGVMGLLLM